MLVFETPSFPVDFMFFLLCDLYYSFYRFKSDVKPCSACGQLRS
ncbi:hypothetical protein SynBOUM118_02748 [Synechococcus sp. BOUM118]|nr:hypothetical protein SynBOUM118_02748 [Synechococcus sp. BOUM118]